MDTKSKESFSQNDRVGVLDSEEDWVEDYLDKNKIRFLNPYKKYYIGKYKKSKAEHRQTKSFG